MKFTTRTLFGLMTTAAACLGLIMAFPPLLVPVAVISLAALMALFVILLVTCIFIAEDKLREFLAKRRQGR